MKTKGSGERLLHQREVTARTAIPRVNIYGMMSRGQFPKPVPINGRSVRWREADVDEWIAQRIDNAPKARAAKQRRRQGKSRGGRPRKDAVQSVEPEVKEQPKRSRRRSRRQSVQITPVA